MSDAIAVFDDLNERGTEETSAYPIELLKKKQARNFQNYLRQHRLRIPDYQLDQEFGICIGSGSVESWSKQIASRV